MRLPDTDTMYKALVEKDSSFEGIFFTGVKTTGIFCRPTCRAKKPKKENVEFFDSTKKAIDYGYRPCKICRPMEMSGNIPDWLVPLLKEIEVDPNFKIKDYELKQKGLDPERVRRWFKKNHNMTFQAYLRSLRINEAFGRIKKGDKVIESAFDSGYESLSGFAESFKKSTGFPPSKSNHRNIITIKRILSPLGPMFAGASHKGICLLEFVDRRMLETQIKRLRERLNAEFIQGTNPDIDILEKQLSEYFSGKRKNFDLKLDIPGTDFQIRVWKLLQKIPYATNRSYKEQADLLNEPKAIRAVARANGDNRIAIIIPCHRVIGSDGQLVGYGGGLWRKKYLLNLEIKNRKL